MPLLSYSYSFCLTMLPGFVGDQKVPWATVSASTPPSHSLTGRCCRPRGVPILNSERMSTPRLCAAAESK